MHVLFGENGAGKSTLISILAGAHQPERGRMFFQRRAARICTRCTRRASCGISAVFQEFSLVPQMTVEENMFLGAEATTRRLPRPKRELRRRAEEIIARLGFPLRADRAGAVSHPRRAADGGDRQGVPLATSRS